MLVGVDLVDIGRLKAVCARTPRFIDRVFSREECEYASAKGDSYPSLAACFAAREAFRKLHPAFTSGIAFQEVRLVHDPTGRPLLDLSSGVQEKASQIGISSFVISISHTDEMAIAVVLGFAEKK